MQITTDDLANAITALDFLLDHLERREIQPGVPERIEAARASRTNLAQARAYAVAMVEGP